MNNKYVGANKKTYLFLLPAMLFLLIFTIYPIVKVVFLSFVEPSGAVGIGNYEYVYKQDIFVRSIFNTVVFTVVVTAAVMVIALLISYLLSLKIKMRNTFQTLFFLPYVTSIIAIGAVFQLLFHSDYGLFNAMLNSLGLADIGWLTDPHFVLVSLIILGIWKGIAFNVLILITAMTSLDKNLDKAAEIDGASSKKIFLKIKLPQLYSVIFFLLTMNIIHGIKVYEEVVALFGTTTAGPGSSASTLVYYLYSYIVQDPAVAAVTAVTLVVIMLFINWVLEFVKKKVIS